NGPEVAAAPAQGPEQIGIFRLTGEAKLAVGGHDVDRYKVVGGIAKLTRGPAEAAAHAETRDPGIGHDPARNHQTERLRLVIDVAPCRAALDANDAARRIDAHAPSQAHVDHQATVAERGPRDIVTAAADRQRHAVVVREIHAGDDVRTAGHP